MKISVIVPVHRVPGELLRACADSLSRQTLADLEILFVLDGPDAEADRVLEVAARQDWRIRILRNETNRGVSAARNRGLAAAQGDWFGFVDADDAVEPEMYAGLLAKAEESRCELVGCRLTYGGSDKGEVLPIRGFAGTFDLASDAAAAQAFERAGLSCCTKLFYRAKFGALRFPEEYGHLEDGLFLQQALQIALRAGFVDAAWYRARRRPDSAQHRRMDGAGFARYYSALRELERNARAQVAGTVHRRRAWGWQLLALSIGNRRYHDELPLADRQASGKILRDFVAVVLDKWADVYPAWLSRMLAWKVAELHRLHVGTELFYSLLWQEIRVGTATYRGVGAWQLTGDIIRRMVKRCWRGCARQEPMGP